VLGEKHSNTILCLNNLVSAHHGLGNFSEALLLSKKAYSLSKEKLGEKHPLTLTILGNFATIYSDLGSYSEALPLSKKVYFLTKEVLGEKHPDTFVSLNNLAGIYYELGHFFQAISLYKKAYFLSNEVLGEKHLYTFTSLHNLADTHRQLGKFSQALPLLKKAYSISKKILGEKHPNTIASINSLAATYEDSGNFSQALLLFEKAYSLIKDVLGEKHPNTLVSLNNLAGIYHRLGSFSQAMPLYEKAYSLSNELLGEKHPKTIIILNNLANIKRELGLISQALPLFEKAYFFFKNTLGEKHPGTLSSLRSLASIYRQLGYFSKALPLSEKAYFLVKEVLGEKHPDILTSLNNLATLYVDLGRFSEALSLFEKGYFLMTEVLGEKHPSSFAILNNLAVYTMQDNPKKSISLFEKLVLGVENLRRGDLSTENRQALFKKWVPSYFRLSSLYFDRSRLQDAFRLTEMSKARTLLESLATQLAAQKTGLSATEQQQLQDNKAQLAFLNNRIAKALENKSLEENIELETEKNQLVSQFNQFHRELMAKYPKYAQLSEVNIIDAIEGAKYLPADAVLISYFVHENEVLVFTLQADGRHTGHDLGKIPRLEEDLITDYREQLFVPIKEPESKPIGSSELIYFGAKPKKNPSLSLQLGQKLLGPLYEVIKDKPHWIISPSGPLALIPFETLRLDGDEQPQVIAKHQISYVQSLSMLALLQERGKVYNNLPCRGELLAMGAPIYKDTRAGITKGHPSTIDFKMASLMVERGNDYTRAFKQLGRENWKALPGALAELEQLEELFKDTKPRIYKQAEATEAKLQHLNKQGVLAQYRYLVFSAHGYLSPQVPALSAIVLGQVNNPPEIDGYVTAAEWPGYDLKSDLMVLSACETGLGEVMRGEGVMGLPYALYVAGNKNTILSLWKLSDDVTAEFITSFFKKLKAGSGQIEALTATKREFLNKGGRYSNPKYWAAFVLYGI
jgi:CHAT domain-containing protein